MSKFRFLVYGNALYGSKECTEDYDFMLSYDGSWNNYGYYTSFKLYDNKGALIGPVNILDICQKPGKINPLVDFERSYRIINELPQDCAAITNCCDLYYNITKILPSPDDRIEFAKAIHLIIYNNRYDHYFKDKDCYILGFFRDYYRSGINLENDPINSLYNRIFCSGKHYYDFKENYLTFQHNDEQCRQYYIDSSRMHYLSSLHSSKDLFLFAYSIYQNCCNIDWKFDSFRPKDSTFNKIIFVTYNSFLNNDWIPKVNKELNREDTNLYCYIGFQERYDLGKYKSEDHMFLTIDKVPIRTINSIVDDLNDDGRLYKKIGFDAWVKICNDYGKLFGNDNFSDGLVVNNGQKIVNVKSFLNLPISHKIFIHAMSMILRNIEAYSILLIDRLDIFLCKQEINYMNRIISNYLEKYNSIAILGIKPYDLCEREIDSVVKDNSDCQEKENARNYRSEQLEREYKQYEMENKYGFINSDDEFQEEVDTGLREAFDGNPDALWNTD